MASPATLDFDKLLAPISEAEPAGVELLGAPAAQRNLLQNAKDAAKTAREAERAALMQDEAEAAGAKPPTAAWKLVRDLTVDILGSHSKDLWVTAWLIEAQARLQGFAGLRDGFRLTRELSERFWEGIHPRPDEDGVSTTVSHLKALNEGSFVSAIDNVTIGFDGDGNPVTGTDYHYAYEFAGKIIDQPRRAELIRRFEQASRTTPADFLQNSLADAKEALAEFDLLVTVLEEKCGRVEGESAAPPSSRIREALVNAVERTGRLSGNTSSAPAESAENSAGGNATVSGGASSGGGGGKLATREDAFRMLLQVAEFFRRTEPHSPVSYALEQTVRWGRMSLPELLGELISNSDARSDLFRLTGIPKSERDD